ncbi:FAD-dependent oxidoreductase [Candidatus Bipolaricaulota bacterium]|nr:FAD-dependent oxidoreductase [Candidatus Bipolaricaulota bacterium]
MKHEQVDVLVLGGGAAGLAAANEAARDGARTALIDRESEPGGVLDQCIHPGFGLHRFQEELTGPEFAHRLVSQLDGSGASFFGERFASRIDPENRSVTTIGPDGHILFSAKSVVIATGARERPFGALAIPGFRPSGILTAGMAQRLVNIEGLRPGNRAIILGSGDIGLIMARRLHLEGVEVVAVLEQKPFPGGLTRNVVQCLDDFGIPLFLRHTLQEIHGAGRLEAVTAVEVDEYGSRIPGTGRRIEADTLILSVGLIPDNELIAPFLALNGGAGGPRVDSRMRTEVDWLFAAGNNTIIFDLADWVARAGETAGRFAAAQAKGDLITEQSVPLVRGENLLHLTPNALTPGIPTPLLLRVDHVIPHGRLSIGDVVSRKLTNASPSEMLEVLLTQDQVRDLCRSTEIRIEVRAE